MLRDGTRTQRPEARLVLCEPFILPCGAVTEAWHAPMASGRRVVREPAEVCDARFVAFQAAFDDARASPCEVPPCRGPPAARLLLLPVDARIVEGAGEEVDRGAGVALPEKRPAARRAEVPRPGGGPPLPAERA